MRKLLVVTAPSGSGKTTVVRHLLDHFDQLAFSVSATTRPPRPGEIDGKDYHFITERDFRARISRGDFVEWEEVYPGRYYGTLRSELERIWARDQCVVFDVDVKGACSLKAAYPADSLVIFVRPPSVAALEARLRSRGTESEATLQIRLRHALAELRYEDRFDVVLVNDILEVALAEATQLVTDFLHS